jgi:hypothetical protein
MSPLTLPGTIPGLLRRGSPCRRLTLGDPVMQEPVLVHAVAVRAHWTDESAPEPCAEIRSGPLTWWPCRALALDLSDPTGRAHAAWWLWRQDINAVELAIATVLGPNTYYAGWLDEVSSGADDSDDDIAALRLVCLHVAGVSP